MRKKVIFELSAFEDLQYWFRADLQTYFKIVNIVKKLETSSANLIKQSQPLKKELIGYYCCKIDDENRLVYKITDTTIFIASCKYY